MSHESSEEIEKAEKKLTNGQRAMSKEREEGYHVGKKDAENELPSQERFLEDLRRFVSSKEDQQTAARELGISPQYLSDILNGHRDPGKSVVEAMGRTIKRIYPEDR